MHPAGSSRLAPRPCASTSNTEPPRTPHPDSGYHLIYSPDRDPKAIVNAHQESRHSGNESAPASPPYARGKVRDVYSLGEQLLIVATDRISAFDYILATGIPDKGRVLTQLSIFWFDFLRDVTPTHFITADVAEYPDALQAFRDQIEGRSMLVKRAKMVEIECVARGYISGLRLERISRARHRLRHSTARRLARERQTPRADLHARHQSPDRPR